MKLKVLYMLPPTRSFAGIERVIHAVAAELVQQYGEQLDVSVLYMTTYEGMDRLVMPYRLIQRSVTTRTSLIRTMRSVALAERYDLIIVPQVEATVIAWLSCLGARRRMVVYLHGNPDREMRSAKARILFETMRYVVLHRLAGVFGVSKMQLAAFARAFPSRVAHYWLPNPVRRFPVPPPAKRAAGAPVTFVTVARLSYQKGQDHLLRAFARVQAARPNVRLALVGYGEDEALLRGEIARLGLDDRVSILYRPSDPGDVLASSDIYVSPSRWEGWSLAICEALRFGLPVIATDCPFGPSDILTDPRLGRLIPPDDEAALAAAMIEGHDRLAEEQAHRAYRMAHIDRYSVETVVADHAQAIMQVCQAGTRPDPVASPDWSREAVPSAGGPGR
ncbi:cellobiosyl-diphosphoprenyl alpha-mannosyltransferase [Methylobacterium tarhaniae]|uniref:Cellobiosyl-diphosphoprenyl alpha-mannosyltransferase n=1 Tax=Methylobacterium tarhaniae TaxID=1187852 RepID=A0A0J6SHJ8_9HYPH|nr:glycosyltransferase [Methylobacterium tarhaniae]KMO33192.1 cellobiosyl-diphosphoprenyl alpha-mannosyltransferase [Methylobacterium tarhaniae]